MRSSLLGLVFLLPVLAAAEPARTGPELQANGQGNFLVVWMDGRELFARSFQADGTPWAPEVRLSVTASETGLPSLALCLAVGRFKVEADWADTEAFP